MRSRTPRLLLTCAGVVLAVAAAYGAVGFMVVPGLLEQRLTTWAQERLGVRLAFERLAVNPFLMTVEAHGVTAHAAQPSPSASAVRALVDFDPLSSFFGRGLVIGELVLEGLSVTASRDEQGSLDIVEWSSRLQSSASKQEASTSRQEVTVRQVKLQDGALIIRDGERAGPHVLRAAPIAFEATDLSTTGKGDFSVSAVIDGTGTVAMQGELALAPLASAGKLQVKQLPLALAWQFVKERTGVARPDGSVDGSLDYNFSRMPDKLAFSITGLEATLTGGKLWVERGGQTLATAESTRIEDGRYTHKDNLLHLKGLALSRGHLAIVTDAAGVLNWSALAGESGEEDAGGPPFRLEIEALRVEEMGLQYADHARTVPLVVEGATLTGSASMGVGSGGVKLSGMNVVSRELTVGTPEERPLQFSAVTLSEGRLDVAARELAVGSLRVDGGQVQILRSPDGRMRLARLLAADRSDVQEREAPTDPWSFTLARAQAGGIAVSIRDESVRPAFAYEVTGLTATARNIGGDGTLEFELAAAGPGGKGRLTARGTAAQDIGAGEASVKLAALSVVPFSAFLRPYALVTVASGNVSAGAEVAWQRSAPRFSSSGSVVVENLALNGIAVAEPVFSSGRLSAEGVRLAIGPDRLEIGEVLLDQPDARVAISAKRELNLAQLVRPRPDNPAKNALPVRVGVVRVKGGTVDFSDDSLVVPFRTRITAFNGSASSVSSDASQHAVLAFRGDIGEFGEARLEGRLNAFSPTRFADVSAQFDNVPVPTLSPYSATFLGRELAGGRLWLELDYRVEDGQLAGDNRITVRDLVLGQRVNAPSALDVPLDLAVALLTDSQGRLTTDLRVTGNVENPKFNVGELVKEALGNLVGRVLSAPFRALGNLFGGGDGAAEELGAVAFEPGSARIAPPEREKLQAMARALKERPQLALVVPAPYHPDDVRALREQLARQSLARAMKAPPGTPVDVTGSAAVEALRGLLASRGHAASGAGEPGGSSSLFEAWIEAQPLDGTAAQRLGVERARAIIEYLASQGVDRARLRTGELVSLQGKSVRAELSLDALLPQRSMDGGEDKG